MVRPPNQDTPVAQLSGAARAKFINDDKHLAALTVKASTQTSSNP
jgi:hypothetical protein